MLKRTTKTRLHIRSIDESQKADSEIAELFREMRQASGLSLEQLAHKLTDIAPDHQRSGAGAFIDFAAME